MKVKRGKVLSAKRQRQVHTYLARHDWVRLPGDGSRPAFYRWSLPERRAFFDWERGFEAMLWETFNGKA